MTDTERQQLSTKIALVEKDTQYIKKSLDELKKVVHDFIETADTKYASKLTEKVVYWIVSLVLVGVFSAIITLVIKSS